MLDADCGRPAVMQVRYDGQSSALLTASVNPSQSPLPPARSSTLSIDHPRYAIEVVNDCLRSAERQGASDVHFDPRPNEYQVWFRLDGVLRPYAKIPRSNQTDPVTRLMAMAGLPTYRCRTPQEALLAWRDEDVSADAEKNSQDTEAAVSEMRLAVFPTLHGPRAVIRRLENLQRPRELDSLGFEPQMTASLRRLCGLAEGLVLVVGPSGGGKTTTLYACLNEIAGNPVDSFRRSVLTIEDPVESSLDRVNQSQIDPAASLSASGAGGGSGMSLLTALRAAVRQDADVLLVSEIRDAATAAAVMDASMTGHLTFSSLHSGSIASALTRLVQMDLPVHSLPSGIAAICNVRLLRKVCRCRRDGEPDGRQGGQLGILPGDASQSAATATAGNRDCSRCGGTGYHGRMPIAQLLEFDNDESAEVCTRMLIRGDSAASIQLAAEQAGLESLSIVAARAVQSGNTDWAEVRRVVGMTDD